MGTDRSPPLDLAARSQLDINAVDAVLLDYGRPKTVLVPRSQLIVVLGPQPVMTHEELESAVQLALGMDAPPFTRPTDRYGDTDAAIRLRSWLVKQEVE